MKWIKLKQAWKTHAAGEKLSIPEAKAASLIEDGIAEAVEDPTAAAVGQIVAEQQTMMELVAKKAADGVASTIVETMKKQRVDKRTGAISVGDENKLSDPTLGFKSFSSFAQKVAGFATQKIPRSDFDTIEKYTQKALTTYSSEAIGADGGFLIPPEYVQELLDLTVNDLSMAPLCRQMRCGGNTLTIPKDETTPWSSDGVQVYWTAEAGAIKQSKPNLGEINITLHKLAALCPVTNEMLEDSYMNLGMYLNQAVPKKIRQAVNNAIFAGTGAGLPLGITKDIGAAGANGAALAVTRQTANSITVKDLATMESLMHDEGQENAVWVCHSTTFPQIAQLTVGNYPVYVAAGGIDKAPNKTIYGRRMLRSEQCATLGTETDFNLIDFSEYIFVTKTTSPQMAMSIHLFFDQDVSTFRFIFRIGGQPWMSKPIQQFSQPVPSAPTNFLSPFVILN